MSNELAVIKDNWLELTDGKKELPVPFQQEIFLQECHVAGTMHVDDILIKTQSLEVGSALRLKREPDNPYDHLAILVETTTGEHIGYVPKKYNQAYARLNEAVDDGELGHRLRHEEVDVRTTVRPRWTTVGSCASAWTPRPSGTCAAGARSGSRS